MGCEESLLSGYGRFGRLLVNFEALERAQERVSAVAGMFVPVFSLLKLVSDFWELGGLIFAYWRLTGVVLVPQFLNLSGLLLVNFWLSFGRF